MSYENPKRLYTGPTGSQAYLQGFNQAMQGSKVNLEKLEQERKIREAEEKRLIEKMQRVQGDADVWNLEQMNKLATAPKTSMIDKELMRTLNEQIDIATQAQIYLKTQFGDNEKRNSAKQAVTDYYDLLNLTQKTTQSFVATGEYWKQNAASIGKKITILGSTPEEISNNQFLVNALGGIYSEANFEMAYDKDKNDIMIKVSGNEPRRLENGELVDGEFREKYISARAWNQIVNQGDNFSFISTVPQLVDESLAMMAPAEKSKNSNGLGIVKSNGQFNDKYWSEPVIFRDRINIEGSKRSRKTEEIREYLNMDLIREDMESILSSKIAGVNGDVQQAANGWNVDLQMLNEGIENDYQTLQPTDDQYKQKLFEKIMEARTSGLVQDSEGRWYKAGSRSIVAPKAPKAPKVANIGYRALYFDNIVSGGDNNQQIVLDNMIKIEGPKARYMSRDNIYQAWLNNPNNPKIPTSDTNEEFYNDKGKDPRAVFNELAPKDGLYKIISGKPVYAGDYDFESAVDRLNFALDNTTASERKAIENETILKSRARKVDWMKVNPQRNDELDADYVKRMNKAIK